MRSEVGTPCRVSVQVSIDVRFDAEVRKSIPADRRPFSGNSGISTELDFRKDSFGRRRSRVELRPLRGLARLWLKSRRPDEIEVIAPLGIP